MPNNAGGAPTSAFDDVSRTSALDVHRISQRCGLRGFSGEKKLMGSRGASLAPRCKLRSNLRRFRHRDIFRNLDRRFGTFDDFQHLCKVNVGAVRLITHDLLCPLKSPRSGSHTAIATAVESNELRTVSPFFMAKLPKKLLDT